MDKHIKIITKILLLTLLFSLLASCTPDGDDDFTLPRDRYIGTWKSITSDNAGYFTTISSDPTNSTRVIIQNYFNLDHNGTVTAYVTEGTITVDNQKMQGASGNHWCEGNGSLTKRSGIYTIYWHKYAAGNEELTATYTKQ